MKIQAKGKKSGATVIFVYDEDNLLKGMAFNNMEEKQVIWVCERIPQRIEVMQLWQQKFAHLFEFAEIPEDIDFITFWNQYAYKVGSRSKAEKLWHKLKDSEKLAALKSINRYESFLRSHPGLGKAYPTTFLNQRRWENEF